MDLHLCVCVCVCGGGGEQSLICDSLFLKDLWKVINLYLINKISLCICKRNNLRVEVVKTEPKK